MVTVGVCSKLKKAENRLFLQIKSGRMLDILWVFLIKTIIPLALVGYEMIIARSPSQVGVSRVVGYLPSHIQRTLVE